MLWPNGTTTRPPISSPYGPRRAPVAGASSFHRGCDFVGFSLVRAVAPGRVVATGTPHGWAAGGIQVWVQHDGALARYMHLKNTPPVRVGDVIPEGRILGIMGRTGNVSGVHLHLEIVVNGVQIDPVPFITDRLGGPAGGGTASPTPTVSEEDDMRIFSTTDGSFYLAKPTGIVGIRNVTDLQLLRRLLNSRTGSEDRFNAAERDILNSYLNA